MSGETLNNLRNELAASREKIEKLQNQIAEVLLQEYKDIRTIEDIDDRDEEMDDFYDRAYELGREMGGEFRFWVPRDGIPRAAFDSNWDASTC